MAFLQISMALSIGSIVFGAAAWVLSILAIAAHKAIAAYRNTTLSFCFCTLSLVLQLFEISNRVNIGDYAAIEDTINAVLIASVVLIVITIVLNIAALAKAAKK